MTRLPNANEAIASIGKRVTQLERRKGGGGGSATIYIGPDYRGTGPAIQVPKVPNPPAVPDTLHSPRPIPDLVIWVRKDGKFWQYDPVTEGLSPSPYKDSIRQVGKSAVNGWTIIEDSNWQKLLVNLRTGKKINYDDYYSEGIIWYDGVSYYTNARKIELVGSDWYRQTYIGSEYPNVLNNGTHPQYVFRYDEHNYVRKWSVKKWERGALINFGPYWPNDVVVKYKLGDSYTGKSVNAEGNVLVRPDGDNKTYLLSGYDGRELGQYPAALGNLAGMAYLDRGNNAYLNRDFSFNNYLSASLIYTSRWLGQHVIEAAGYDGRHRALINLNDGSINRIVPYSSVVFDITMT